MPFPQILVIMTHMKVPGSEDKVICPYHSEHTYCTSHIRLFQQLPEKEQIHLLENAAHVHLNKGSVLAHEGQDITEILIIRKGRIKTCRLDAEGNEYILDILHDGHAIWHDMFLKDHIYHYNIVALTDCEICEISREEFISVLKGNPEAAMGLITMLSTELYEAKEKSVLLSVKDPAARLAGFLLNRDVRCLGHEISLKLDDIAASISLRPETVSRNLVKLEKSGYVKRIGKGKIMVTDRIGLQKFYDAEKK